MAKRTYGTRAARTMKPKNTKQEMDRERGAWSVERGALTLHSEIWTFHAPRSTLLPASRAFTLIEMLVVIAVISLLAAMIFPITGAVTRNRIRSRTRTELEQIATYIELY